jgi:hypothetical protein
MTYKDERRKKEKPCGYCGEIFRTRKAAFCSKECCARAKRGQRARLENGVGVIPLSQGAVALVDGGDFDRVNQYIWTLRISKVGNRYAERMAISPDGRRRTELMHRFILGLTDSDVHTDHRDGDGLNNQRFNLRSCIRADNAKNRRKLAIKTSRFKGVTYRRRADRWEAKIRVSTKLIYLGHYMTEEDAARAYNEAALKHFGEFANLNAVDGPAPAKNRHAGYTSRKEKACAHIS